MDTGFREALYQKMVKATIEPLCEEFEEGIVLHEWEQDEKKYEVLWCTVCENKHIIKGKIFD